MSGAQEQGIPQWARDRADELCLRESSKDNWCSDAFARYIAAHEEPPVDPLLIEARKIAASQGRLTQLGVDCYLRGIRDDDEWVKAALAGLKRGIELAQSGGL